MKTIISVIILILSSPAAFSDSNTMVGVGGRAGIPPKGWNSYDSFGWTITEEQFLQNAAIISQKLLPSGYQYVVVDYLWYRRNSKDSYSDSLGFDVIDEWGRVIPDAERWPSSKGGKGFTEISKKIHSLGLKFGIHVMRGISTQAVNSNTPILDPASGKSYQDESGVVWRAADIGSTGVNSSCSWMPHGFMAVNTTFGASLAFLRSLYLQYSQWGVDFVKHDCVFGDDFEIEEMESVSDILRGLEHPMLYSVSPGTNVVPAMGRRVGRLVNMYRITGDVWDSWGDIESHFDISRDFALSGLVGGEGLSGRSWPDLDMLPLGTLTDPGSRLGPHRMNRLTVDEARSMMTLWSMAKSPLIIGGDMRNLDDVTHLLITNPTIIEIDSFTSRNSEFFPNITILHKGFSRNFSTERVVLRLVGCGGGGRWYVERDGRNGGEMVCLDMGFEKVGDSLCIYKNRSFGGRSGDKFHLLSIHTHGFCLDSSLRWKNTTRGSRIMFSLCRGHSSQLWEMTKDGMLQSSNRGLCATADHAGVGRIEAATGIRSWVATIDTRREIYVALFNLNEERMSISMNISDLDKVVPREYLNGTHCSCRDVWEGEEVDVRKGSILTLVEAHGCVLFVLSCIT